MCTLHSRATTATTQETPDPDHAHTAALWGRLNTVFWAAAATASNTHSDVSSKATNYVVRTLFSMKRVCALFVCSFNINLKSVLHVQYV